MSLLSLPTLVTALGVPAVPLRGPAGQAEVGGGVHAIGVRTLVDPVRAG